MHKDSAFKMLCYITMKRYFILMYFSCAQRQFDCRTEWADRLSLLSLDCLRRNNASVDGGRWWLLGSEYQFFLP